MRKLAALAAVLLTFTIGAVDVEAKRLGGARSSGIQRQSTQPATPPAQSGTPGTPSTAGAPAQAGAAAAAVAPPGVATAKRGWSGPLTGLAAGLGLAALASYLGFGEAIANIMLIALVMALLLASIGFVIRRRAAGGALRVAAGGGAGIDDRFCGGLAHRRRPGRQFDNAPNVRRSHSQWLRRRCVRAQRQGAVPGPAVSQRCRRPAAASRLPDPADV